MDTWVTVSGGPDPAASPSTGGSGLVCLPERGTRELVFASGAVSSVYCSAISNVPAAGKANADAAEGVNVYRQWLQALSQFNALEPLRRPALASVTCPLTKEIAPSSRVTPSPRLAASTPVLRPIWTV